MRGLRPMSPRTTTAARFLFPVSIAAAISTCLQSVEISDPTTPQGVQMRCLLGRAPNPGSRYTKDLEVPEKVKRHLAIY
uniref:Secreted protein n=1 Tax=Oryza brachyantha TaxID=4533 RepID=J3LKM3_ORYBR